MESKNQKSAAGDCQNSGGAGRSTQGTKTMNYLLFFNYHYWLDEISRLVLHDLHGFFDTLETFIPVSDEFAWIQAAVLDEVDHSLHRQAASRHQPAGYLLVSHSATPGHAGYRNSILICEIVYVRNGSAGPY